MPDIKIDLHYFNEIFPISQYQDDFGWSNEWNQEIEKWLSFANSFDTNWYNSNKARANREKQRDEFLGECKALYYFGTKLGCRLIQMDPQGKGNHKLDFTFEDVANNLWYVEVKSPSWRSVESKKIDNEFSEKSESERAELKRKRWTQPQHIKGRGGSFSEKDAIIDAVRKASDQFAKGKNNLLIIAPNMIEGDLAIALSRQFNGAPVQECIDKYDTAKTISYVCLLDVKLYLGSDELKYSAEFVKCNTNKLSLKFTTKV